MAPGDDEDSFSSVERLPDLCLVARAQQFAQAVLPLPQAHRGDNHAGER